MADTRFASENRSEIQPHSPVRVGIIGCGGIAQARHLPEAAANPHARLTAVCDINIERAQQTAKKYDVPEVYGDYLEMLARAKLDLVVVCTPNALHAEQSIYALEAGLHVLVEKPMAGTEEDARRMISTARRMGKWLMVGQNQRLTPPHVLAKKILDSGELGRVLNFQTTFKHAGPGFWSADGTKTWFFQSKLAVMGVCGDLGVHKVDLMMFLLGEPIVLVNGFADRAFHVLHDGSPIDVEDTAFLTVRTASGVIGTVNLSWTHFGRGEENGTTIYCEKGVLSLANDPEFPVVVHRHDGSKTFHKTGAVATNTKQVPSGVIDEMISAIRENRPPLIGGEEGLRALRVILAALEAARVGRNVAINFSHSEGIH